MKHPTIDHSLLKKILIRFLSTYTYYIRTMTVQKRSSILIDINLIFFSKNFIVIANDN